MFFPSLLRRELVPGRADTSALMFARERLKESMIEIIGASAVEGEIIDEQIEGSGFLWIICRVCRFLPHREVTPAGALACETVCAYFCPGTFSAPDRHD